LFETQPPAQRALVVHPIHNGMPTTHDPELRLIEASGLAHALDLDVIEARREQVRQIKAGAYFGDGKLDELKARVATLGADVMVLDDQISPVQQRNLEKALNIKVIDRTGLILEIFARRAATREGKLQVELARQTYERSRLVRTWTHLERQRGGTGKTGGPGERQIELDRRLIAERIVKLKKELEDVRRTRALQRQSRKRVPYPVVALVGYTNAGKSTLFNRSASAKVFAKDMPFATLDTTLRALRTPMGRDIILSDTVGFITDLPTELVAAFRATLEEVAQADILIHVRDIAHSASEAQKRDVEEVLERVLKETEPKPPIIEAWNKLDAVDADQRTYLVGRARASGLGANGLGTSPGKSHEAVCISAITGEGLSELFEAIDAELSVNTQPFDIVLGPEHGEARAWLFRKGGVVHEDDGHEDGSVRLSVRLSPEDSARFSAKWPALLSLPPLSTLRQTPQPLHFLKV
jgi:GTPase